MESHGDSKQPDEGPNGDAPDRQPADNSKAERLPNGDPPDRLPADLRQEEHVDELAKTVRRLIYILLITSAYLVLTLAEPDWKLVRADTEIALPLAGPAAGVKVQLSVFLTFVPIILVAQLIYLHLFIGQLVKLAGLGISPPENYIFVMRQPAARVLSDLLLYAFGPIVLAWFTWKTLFRDEALFLAVTTAIVAFMCAGLYLERAREQGQGTRMRVGLGALAAIAATVVVGGIWLQSFGTEDLLRWRQIDLANAQLGVTREVHYVDLRKLDLRYADAREAVFSRADLRETKLDHVDLTDAKLDDTQLESASLRHAKLARANLNGANLIKAKLDHADLRQATLKDTDLRCASLFKAKLIRAKGAGADFGDADLSDADLRRSAFPRALFSNAKLAGVNAVLGNFENARFGGADLSRANFEDAEIFGSLFNYAKLFDAKFRSAKGIDKSKMTGAKFCKTEMPDGQRDDHCPDLKAEMPDGQRNDDCPDLK